ncbi:MAG: hypothetical protein U9Q27_01525 [Patescibacteria group bacterium]|nr:hypothetical protein [Patescibacteria group bacterium]
MNYYKNRKYNEKTLKYRSHPKFNVPVIGHFSDKSIRYNSILDAEKLTGINYHNIFDACVGRIYRAGLVYWEFENGRHWIKYHAKHVKGRRILRKIGFNG